MAMFKEVQQFASRQHTQTYVFYSALHHRLAVPKPMLSRLPMFVNIRILIDFGPFNLPYIHISLYRKLSVLEGSFLIPCKMNINLF